MKAVGGETQMVTTRHINYFPAQPAKLMLHSVNHADTTMSKTAETNGSYFGHCSAYETATL
jgi:hypothetical protein